MRGFRTKAQIVPVLLDRVEPVHCRRSGRLLFAGLPTAREPHQSGAASDRPKGKTPVLEGNEKRFGVTDLSFRARVMLRERETINRITGNLG